MYIIPKETEMIFEEYFFYFLQVLLNHVGQNLFPQPPLFVHQPYQSVGWDGKLKFPSLLLAEH